MFTPFNYQEECLSAVETVRDGEGSNRALVVMASGLGKTVTVGFDVKRWREKERGRVLYLCHQNDILAQARTTFEAIQGDKSTYGYFHGYERNFHKTDFLFSSLQTMKRYKQHFDPEEFAYIIDDESHHSQATTYRSTIEYFRPKFLLGITATPNRLDELNIRDIFGEEVYSLPLEEALARRLLCPVDYRLMTDDIVVPRELLGKGRPPSVTELNKMVFARNRDEKIVRTIERHMKEIDRPRIIIFMNSIADCNRFAALMPESFAIHSRVPAKERAVRLELFRQGMVKAAITVDVFNEGIDVPQANMIVFLRSTDSRTIFFQQLGRGLRKSGGKKKVLVLDFAANCERILMVHDLHERVVAAHEKVCREKRARGGTELHARKLPLPMTLNVDTPEFREKIIPLLQLLKRLRPNFYPTWQQAGGTAKTLGIASKEEYAQRYAEDPHLPASPRYTYRDDFPGWEIFLGKRTAPRYETWQEASRASIQRGFKIASEYRERYMEDPRLPADPPAYKNFPGWVIFLGGEVKNFYTSWKKISSLCKRNKVSSVEGYRELCEKDKRLPRYPQDAYQDFPGFAKIFGTRRLVENPYPTWQEAAEAAKKLGIKSSVEYAKRFKKDKRLYAAPSERYADFPGWTKFLGTKGRHFVSNPYPTWQEASRAAEELGIKSSPDYRRRRKEDQRLFANPENRYKDFPGWPKFLGKVK